MTPRVVAAGDSTLVVEFEERIALDVNARVLALARHVAQLRLAGVRDVVPTYRSVAVAFDPLATDVSALEDALQLAARKSSTLAASATATISIPVCYDAEFAPDLDRVAAHSGLDRDTVIALHTSGSYHVFMLGFMPGFAYMGSVDARIAAPRLASPRPRVAAGSVGIAGEQTGIYPSETPGGWNIIGRTPVRTWRADGHPPALIKAGDIVTFHAIDRATFDRWPSNGARQS
ncbi:MAG: 5-oxoprolinase subunit PxpB [Vicinamibacterales bacterium]